jgi:peptide/nickel transport system substrate-binding protein
MTARFLAAAAAICLAASAAAAQTPQRGGNLTFAVAGDPNTYDCHQANSFAVLHYVAPHYSTLLKFKPGDYPKIAGDVAESWRASPDGTVWTFTLREGVRFHDGSALTSSDVKATFDRLRDPPQGVASVRRAQFEGIAGIDAPAPRTVVFRLRAFDAAFESVMASPWNCIYSAALMARDSNYPARRVMGSGPFEFVEHAPGSHWAGKRFDGYFERGLPYLDGFRALKAEGQPAINALAAGNIQAEFRGVTPPQRERIRQSRGERMRFYEGDRISVFVVAFNTERKPFDDVRVRQALTLAIDRPTGHNAMLRISSVRNAGGLLRPGSEWAATPQELAASPGFGPDIRANRERARRLLAEAGVRDLRVRISNRNIDNPYQQLAVFLIDQWRQIGVTGENIAMETGPWQAGLTRGDFDAIIDFAAEPVEDPTILLERYTSFDRAPNNAARSIDEMFERQRREADRVKRREIVRQLEARILDQAATVPLFWAFRIIPVASEVKGWPFSPSHFIYQDLATVWIDPAAR